MLYRSQVVSWGSVLKHTQQTMRKDKPRPVPRAACMTTNVFYGSSKIVLLLTYWRLQGTCGSKRRAPTHLGEVLALGMPTGDLPLAPMKPFLSITASLFWWLWANVSAGVKASLHLLGFTDWFQLWTWSAEHHLPWQKCMCALAKLKGTTLTVSSKKAHRSQQMLWFIRQL